MRIRKIGYIILGCVGVGLGAVGAVLPCCIFCPSWQAGFSSSSTPRWTL